jgi:hypothetical protein
MRRLRGCRDDGATVEITSREVEAARRVFASHRDEEIGEESVVLIAALHVLLPCSQKQTSHPHVSDEVMPSLTRQGTAKALVLERVTVPSSLLSPDHLLSAHLSLVR